MYHDFADVDDKAQYKQVSSGMQTRSSTHENKRLIDKRKNPGVYPMKVANLNQMV